MVLKDLNHCEGSGDRPSHGFCSWLGMSVTLVALGTLLTACGLPQMEAADRLFSGVGLTLLDDYELTLPTFEDTPIGGLSAITYDRQRDLFYVLADDRSVKAPARFYTLNPAFAFPEQAAAQTTARPKLETVTVESVTFLRDEARAFYPPGSLDPEGMALTPAQTLFISSEGDTNRGVDPFIGEFDLATGHLQRYLPLPKRYRLDNLAKPQRGVQNNLGFEALTLGPTGLAQGEPLRLFVATEAPLIQDEDPDRPSEEERPNRFLHYLIGNGSPELIAEYFYPLNPPPPSGVNGLVELLALDQRGNFLSLERSASLDGFQAQIFEVAIDGATDTSRIASLRGNLDNTMPLSKRRILDLATLEISLDNLEGMTFGPYLPDGSRTLILVSDSNFREEQKTQFLWFRLDAAALP